MITPKVKRNPKTFLALAITLLAASSLQAGVITGVTVTTNMGNAGGTNISQIVDGSGLSSYITSATHATGTGSNDWISQSLTGTVTFNLGGSYAVDGMAVWNFNAGNVFGVQALTVLGSTDGVSFSLIGGAPTAFAIGQNFAPESAQLFGFSTTASFIRFNITSNYGTVSSSGLSEVMFTGTAAAPEPATWSLIAAGLAALAFAGRKGSA